MVNIVKKIVPESKYNLKCPYKMTPEFVVIHNTANDASAQNEISYMTRNDKETSFHYAVDEKEIIQGIEENRNAWHAGDGNGPGNRKGIAIEICWSKSGGEKFVKAEQNAAELAASILKRYGWGIDKLTKHQDYSGKYCPHRTLDMGWDRFKAMVQEYLDGDSEAEATAPVTPTDTNVDVFCCVRAGRRWWYPEVKNLTDFAGVIGKAITDIAIRVTRGSVKYRVHVKGGNWLPWVTGYDLSDAANGYAGNGREIDAVEVYYYTPSDIRPVKKAKYRVSPVKGDYYPWQYDNETTNGQDGYAGVFGKSFDRFQIVVE